VVVRIVDQCGDCPAGSIDLSPQAFERIADLGQGRVPVTWRYVPCTIEGNIMYHFKEGSNQWWTAVQIRNHRNPIVRLEYRTTNGAFRTVTRAEYNYFVEPNGMGPGPYTFRVTDVYGHTLTDSNIPHIENGDVPGSGQFPLCPSR
jgi:expansin (peptidoglycan-binding protein)